MTPGQKQRAQNLLALRHAERGTDLARYQHGVIALLQELIDAPEQATKDVLKDVQISSFPEQSGVPDGFRELLTDLLDWDGGYGSKGYHASKAMNSRMMLFAMLDAPEAPAVQADLVKDAERYRYLRACNSGSLMITHLIGIGDCDEIVLTGNDADEAIDAAIAAEKGGA